jgi:hypothetical protein
MFGMGGGNRSSLRFIRIGALILILLIGAAFHDKGSVYNSIHIVYIVLIVALLATGIVLSRRSRGSGNQGRGYNRGRGPGRGPNMGDHPQVDDRVGGGSFGSGPPPTPPHAESTNPPSPPGAPPMAPPPAAGVLPEHTDPET